MATWYSWILSASFSTTDDLTWGAWISDGGTASATGNTWNQWADTTGGTNVSYRRTTTDESIAAQQWGAPRQPSAEEIEAARIKAEACQRELERQQKETKEAEERAERLLQENLSHEQKAAYAERKVIPITTAKGNRYLIRKGRAGNVVRLDGDREVEKFCIHPIEQCPDEDVMLAQILWLRWMEEDFLRIANVTRLAA